MSEVSSKKQLSIARQHLDQLFLFISSLVAYIRGANPAIEAELEQIRELLSGKPNYSGANSVLQKLSADLKADTQYIEQQNLNALFYIQSSLRALHDLDSVDGDTKSEINAFIDTLVPRTDNVGSPIKQFEQALALFRKALANTTAAPSQKSREEQRTLHIQITQELRELLMPYAAKQRENKVLLELTEKLKLGLNHTELLECCLAMIRFVIKDVIKETGTANKLIHDIHSSIHKVNVGITSTIEKSQSQMQKRLAHNCAMRKQINAIESTFLDTQPIEDLKAQAQSYLATMQQSLTVTEADDRSEQEKMIALLTNMQKRLVELEEKADGFKQKLTDQRANALTDGLTQLPNRMAYEEKITHTYALAKANGTPLCMALIDIDNFKRINDLYGHSVGDKTLKIIATQIKQNLKSIDFVARWGGEEFIALMPESSLSECFDTLDAIREKISTLPFMFKGNRVTVTVSIGLADVFEHDSIEAAFDQSDKLLYSAKQNGRNQIKVKDDK